MKKHIILLVMLCIVGFRAGDSTAQQDSAVRLQLIERTGQPLQALATSPDNILLAEGDMILRFSPDAAGVPIETARLQLDNTVRDIVADRSRAYVLTENHIFVINLQNFNVQHQIAGSGESLSVQDDDLLVLNADAGVRQYQITDEGDLRLRRVLPTMNRVQQAVMLPDETVLVLDQAAGIEVFAAGSTTTMAAALPAITAQGLALQDTTLFARDGHRLQWIDVTNPTAPQIVGSYAPLHAAHSAAVVRDYLVVADATDGLKVYNRNFQYENSQLRNSARFVGADPSGRWLVASHSTDVKVYDARSLPQLQPLATLPVWDTPGRISFTPDGLALVAVDNGGLAVVDLQAQTILAGLPFSGPVVHTLAHPTLNIWYVLLGDGRLLTLNFDRNRAAVQTIFSDFDVPGQPQMLALQLQQDRLIVAAGRAGALVFEITDPRQPQLQSSIAALNSIQAMYARDDVVLVQDAERLRVLTVEGDRFRQSFVATPDAMEWLVPEGEDLLVGGAQQLARWQPQPDGIWQPTTTYRAPQTFTAMTLATHRLVLAADNGQLHVLDITTPNRPQLNMIYETAIQSEKLAWWRQHVVLLDLPTAAYRFPLGGSVTGETAQQISLLYQTAEPRQSLQPRIPADLEEIPATITELSSALVLEDVTWFGTRSGNLWRQNAADNDAVRVFEALGGAVLSMSQYDAETLLLSLGEQGLAWVDVAEGIVLRRAEAVTALAAAVDAQQTWLAVATGRCGLAVYNVNTLALQALAQDGTVSDVRFRDGEIEALVDGYLARYTFNPSAPGQPLPPLTIQLLPPTDTQLRWEVSTESCVPLEYEVVINGEVVTQTTATAFSRADLPDTQFTWQVVAVDDFGNRNASPEQLVETAGAGWLAIAQQYQPLQPTVARTSSTPAAFPWLYGLVLVLAGAVGLWRLYRFWQFRR